LCDFWPGMSVGIGLIVRYWRKGHKMSRFGISSLLGRIIVVLILCNYYMSVVELVSADCPPVQWHRMFGLSKEDSGKSVQQTADGGYIVTGWSMGPHTGNTDVYLIKTEPNGSRGWEKRFSEGWRDEGYCVQQTVDGGYIIAGRTFSFGAEKGDVYLVKLCSDGTLAGDLNCDGTVNYKDVAMLVGQWLQEPSILYPPVDIAGFGDGIVNFPDFSIMAEKWMEE
jgi:hypothetical protein